MSHTGLVAFITLFAFGALPGAFAQDDIPASVQQLRQGGPLDIQMRTDTGRDVHLRMETQYTTQDFGNQLTTQQIEKLDTIRAEAPDKFQILSCLFPRQIAEFLLRTPSQPQAAPADDALQRLVWEIGSEYISRPQGPAFTQGQRRARADFVKASLQCLPAQPPAIQHLLEQASQYEDPDFTSADNANTFLVLKDWYSPYRAVGMSIVGDVLRVDGGVVTEHLAADAAMAGQEPEEYAQACYARYCQALDQWRAGQVTGNAYAGSIRRFLNDPRLANFTPEEVSRAYKMVYGRDLKTDLEADRMAARLGHPVTYAEIRARTVKE
jgi:hypothetical protein